MSFLNPLFLFGLAAAADLERMTQTGALIGTPYYMSPEQISGTLADVGPRADVWSLGVVLYQALTRELPFVAPTLMELAAQISRGSAARPRSAEVWPKPTEARDRRPAGSRPARPLRW